MSDVNEVLQESLALLSEAEVPEDLRAIAFEKVFDALASRRGIAPAPVQTPDPPPDEKGAADSGGGSSESDAEEGPRTPYSSIAERLGVSVHDAKETFNVAGDKVELILPSSKLADAKREAQGQIALLLTAARLSAGLDEEWTATSVIMDACQDFGKEDSNFARNLAAHDEWFRFSGPSRSRSVKLTRPGWEAAAKLLQQLMGSEP